MPQKKQANTEVEILSVEQRRITVAAVGTTPFICNRVSEKAKRELLLPVGRKSAAAKAQSMKHDVLQEFRASPYTLDDGPTLLAFLAVGFKRAMMNAALDVPGTSKAQIGRLIRVEGERLALYGVPQLYMAITRSADIKRTPDVRTRAIVPHWAVLLDITFPTPHLKEKSILNLLAAAGLFSGVGDYRTEKGSGNYGSFRLAGEDDPELRSLLTEGGRDAQVAAMNSPAMYDQETADLFEWYQETAEERGFTLTA